jgi:hypothetical protein
MKLSLILFTLCMSLRVVAQTTITDAQLKGRTIEEVHKLLGEPLHSESEKDKRPSTAKWIALGPALGPLAGKSRRTEVSEVWALSPHDYLTVVFSRQSKAN